MNASADYTRLAGYLASDPDNLELLAAVVDAAIDGGVPERAVAHADHALARAPGHPQFIYRRAVALRRCDRLDEARAALEALVAAGETHPVPLCELAEILLAQRDFEGCLALLDRLSATGPDHAMSPQADLLRVRALHHLGRVDEAITCAEAVLATQPQRADIAAALATLYLDAERLDDAARMHAQAAAGGRLDAELHAVGGYLALAAEDEALAQQRFAQALALRPRVTTCRRPSCSCARQPRRCRPTWAPGMRWPGCSCSAATSMAPRRRWRTPTRSIPRSARTTAAWR